MNTDFKSPQKSNPPQIKMKCKGALEFKDNWFAKKFFFGVGVRDLEAVSFIF